jgi:hypothetical protein
VTRRGRGTFLVVSAAAAGLFWFSPVRHMSDSRYSLLLGTHLLRHGTLTLDRYFEEAPASTTGPVVKVTRVAAKGELSGPVSLPQYQIERVNGRLYYVYPHAGSLLALPYVALLRAFGISVIDAEGGYRPATEQRLQAGLAAILMGLTTGVFYLTAREMLPVGPSAVLALLGALGTQVWSTASRVLWSDTWGVTLLAVVVWLLVAARVRNRRLDPYLLGSLLAWAYFVRPTNSVHAVVVWGYVAVAHRPLFARVSATGALWGLAFVGYSFATFGAPLPSYFQPRHLTGGDTAEAVLANLASPSRGLLFYVPVVPLALVLLWRYRRFVRERRLALLGVAGIATQFVPVALFPIWWGGYSYGPRLLTGLVPWALLVGVLAVRARVDAAAEGVAARSRRRLGTIAVALVCAWSVLVNGRGAWSAETGRWNVDPVDVDAVPSRVWDWRDPQFLKGLHKPSAPALHAGVPIALGQAAADGLFAAGWSIPEGELRWSVAPTAALNLRWPAAGPLLLRFQVRPSPAWVASGGQPLSLWLDGRELARWHLSEPGPVVVATPVSSDGSGEEHRLELRVPERPARVAGADRRPLTTAVYTLRVDPFPLLGHGNRLTLGDDAGSPFVGNGWGAPEGSYRWTVAPRADLYFGSGSPEPAILRMWLHPFLAEGDPAAQRVFVDLNGTVVGTLALRSKDAAEHALALIDVAHANTLGFELPDAASPYGERLDPRRLGVALHWLVLEPFPPLSPGRPVALGEKDAAAYLGDGWAEPEGSTRWSVGLKSEIFFNVDQPGPARLVLTMEPFWARRHPSQRVRIDLNDERLVELVLDRQGRTPHAIAVPAGVMRTHNVLRLILPDARSPASVGLNEDRRVLGVRVETLELRPQ